MTFSILVHRANQNIDRGPAVLRHVGFVLSNLDVLFPQQAAVRADGELECVE